MNKAAGEWVYRTPEQYELSRFSEELLNWNLYVFDCWLFDDRNWAMYTSGRQRMIFSREELARLYPAVMNDTSEAGLLLVAHCVTVWRCTRNFKFKSTIAVKEMELAYAKARGIHRAALSLDRAGSNLAARGRANYGHLQTIHASSTDEL